ncbi:MAG: hypothetical protein WCT77_14930 [Bacteroidota bacterium]
MKKFIFCFFLILAFGAGIISVKANVANPKDPPPCIAPCCTQEKINNSTILETWHCQEKSTTITVKCEIRCTDEDNNLRVLPCEDQRYDFIYCLFLENRNYTSGCNQINNQSIWCDIYSGGSCTCIYFCTFSELTQIFTRCEWIYH